MTIRRALLALALSGLPLVARPMAPALALVHADERLRVAALVEAACSEERTPERLAARDALFREIRPRLVVEGAPPSPQDAVALVSALTQLPCASGAPRLERAFVHGDLAYVVAAGAKGGGCSYLLRRSGARWVELLPCGWSLRT